MELTALVLLVLLDSPDKNPNVKGIAERFARLGTIWGILKKPEGRKRYDVS